MKSILLAGAAILGLAGTVQAAQITLGNSTAGSVTFTGTGATGNLTVSETAITGSAIVNGNSGLYTIAAFGPALATHGASGVWNFAPGVTATFFASDAVGDSVTQTLTYTSVNDGSVNPHFAGTDIVTAVTGSAAFTATWAVGTHTLFDYSVNNVATVLDVLALTTASETIGISSGQDVTVAASEPGGLAILGMGLLSLGFLTARRKRS
jgi:MYXO-CTERM domain-containing protein